MISRDFPIVFVCVSLFLGGSAVAQQAGTTSGPSSGKNVEPSTATEKTYQGNQNGAPVGAGSPGVEAKPGTEGGKAEQPGK